MHLPCLIIAFYVRIYTRLWRVGYRQVVLGCRKHFGCPKTQLANFVNFVDFSSARDIAQVQPIFAVYRKAAIMAGFNFIPDWV